MSIWGVAQPSVESLFRDAARTRSLLKPFSVPQLAVDTQLVDRLPVQPQDRTEVYFLADEAAGIVWHLRYRAKAPSVYRWEVLGQPPSLYTRDDTIGLTTTSTSFADLADSPVLRVPLGGDYDAAWGADVFNTAVGNTQYAGLRAGTQAATDARAARGVAHVANYGIQVRGDDRITALVAADDVTMRYRVSGGTGKFQFRWLRLTPVRVG